MRERFRWAMLTRDLFFSRFEWTHLQHDFIFQSRNTYDDKIDQMATTEHLDMDAIECFV